MSVAVVGGMAIAYANALVMAFTLASVSDYYLLPIQAVGIGIGLIVFGKGFGAD